MDWPKCPKCGTPGSSKGFQGELIWIPTCQCGKGLFPEKPMVRIWETPEEEEVKKLKRRRREE